MIEYTISKKKILLDLLIGTIFLYAFFYFHSEESSWIVELLISFLIVLIGFFAFFIKKRLYKLKIDISSQTVFLFSRKYFFVESSVTILFSSLTFSFKKEVGTQGIKSDEFRIYDNKIKLSSIRCAIDGWEKKTVDEIVAKFRELGLNEIK